MKIIDSSLEAMAVDKEGYPKDDLIEIALVGRSNVGKSSFINSFAGRRKLAYTSSSPGKTRTVNFYRISYEQAEVPLKERKDFRLVDLPGYGYAKASKREQEAWAESIDEYLFEAPFLREVILIADLRHDPTSLDKQMMDWILDQGFKGYVIASKGDKLSKNKQAAGKKAIAKKLAVSPEFVFPYAAFLSGKSFGLDKINGLFERIISENSAEEDYL